jgi:hypothetical protein
LLNLPEDAFAQEALTLSEVEAPLQDAGIYDDQHATMIARVPGPSELRVRAVLDRLVGEEEE